MVNALRILLFNSKYGRQCTGGILQSSFRRPKTCSSVQNLGFYSFLNLAVKYSAVKSFPRQLCTFHDFKYQVRVSKRPSDFEKLSLGALRSSKITEGILMNAFHKIFKVYKKNSTRRTFDIELKNFVASNQFKDFCKVLDTKLQELSPSSLIVLVNLEVFQVPLTSSLMRKLLTLILENINKFSVFEKVYLYNKLLENDFTEAEECKNLIKACEVYFEKGLESDLEGCKDYIQLIDILEVPVLPVSVRKLISHKLAEDAFIRPPNHKVLTRMTITLSNSAYDLLPRNAILRLYKKCLCTFYSMILCEEISAAYTLLIQRDESFFDEEVVGLTVSCALSDSHAVSSKIKIINNLCKMGYYNNDLINTINAHVLSNGGRNLKKHECMVIANILARCCFHVIEPEEEVRDVRYIFESLDVEKKAFSFAELCTFGQHLTCIGCNTKNLSSQIFGTIKDSIPSSTEELPENILLLHHIAKAYLQSGYRVLPDTVLHNLVLDELKRVSSFSSESLNNYLGGEDYVLKGCTTSDKHCLHFVSLFGPDNKPIDLSEYAKIQSQMPHDTLFNVEEIKKPPGSKMIVFHIFKDEQPIKFLNAPYKSGIAEMHLKSFENVDCSVVLLPPSFFRLKPDKKEEYLRGQINEILEKP